MATVADDCPCNSEAHADSPRAVVESNEANNRSPIVRIVAPPFDGRY
jgi:hypothetical protein